MPRINIVRDDGTVVSVDESVVKHAAGLGVDAGTESAAGARARVEAEKHHEMYGGPIGTAVAASTGVMDALTLGAFSKVAGAIGGENTRQDIQASAREHPVARGVGELGALLIPGLGELGAARTVGRGAEALGAGRGAAAIEGAAYGVGGTIADTNVSGDPLTIESLVRGATIGGVLGYGAGVLADTLGGIGKSATAQAEAGELSEKAGAMFEEPSPAYDELVSARRGSIEVAQDTNALAARQETAMAKYAASTEDFIRDRNGFNKALDEVFVGANNPTGALPAGWSPEVTRADALDTMGRAAKAVNRATALRTTDMEAALDLLRPVRDELAKKFDIVIPDLPTKPVSTVPVPSALPKTLEGFARMRADTVAGVSHMMTQPEADALAKLIKEKDLIPGATPNGSLADVHAVLSTHARALDTLESAVTPGNSLLTRALRYAAKKGGKSFVGSVLGGATGIPGGHAVGAAVGGMLAGEAVTAASMSARVAARTQISEMVAKFAGPTAKGISSLGPVSAYLSRAFPSGKKDKATDLGDLAKNRVRDLTSAAIGAPNATYAAVQPIIGIPGDVALKVHQHVNQTLAHTVQNAPKDPGFDPRGTKSGWKPSAADGLALAYRLEALQHPLDAIARLLGGDVHPAAIDALRANWPALLGATAEELMDRSHTLNDLPPDRAAGHSALLGNPMSGLDVPENALALQAMYQPGASDARQPQPQGGGTVGRPPKAGRSSVAGSNVSSLISDGQS